MAVSESCRIRAHELHTYCSFYNPSSILIGAESDLNNTAASVMGPRTS